MIFALYVPVTGTVKQKKEACPVATPLPCPFVNHLIFQAWKFEKALVIAAIRVHPRFIISSTSYRELRIDIPGVYAWYGIHIEIKDQIFITFLFLIHSKLPQKVVISHHGEERAFCRGKAGEGYGHLPLIQSDIQSQGNRKGGV